jgi:hypothetical protein
MAAPCFHSFSRKTRRCELCGEPAYALDVINPSRAKKTGGRSRLPVRLEKVEQAEAVNLLTRIGAKVYVLGTVRGQRCWKCHEVTRDQGTRQTEGIGDLWVFLPVDRRPLHQRGPFARPLFCWIEMKSEERAKRKDGGLSDDQLTFREFCLERMIPHVHGTFKDVYGFLATHGFIIESR